MISSVCAVNICGVVSRYPTPMAILIRKQKKMVGNCRRRKSMKDLSISVGELASNRLDWAPPTPTNGSFKCNIYIPPRNDATIAARYPKYQARPLAATFDDSYKRLFSERKLLITFAFLQSKPFAFLQSKHGSSANFAEAQYTLAKITATSTM